MNKKVEPGFVKLALKADQIKSIVPPSHPLNSNLNAFESKLLERNENLKVFFFVPEKMRSWVQSIITRVNLDSFPLDKKRALKIRKVSSVQIMKAL